MDTDKVKQRFDRIEGYIDNVYDAVYGAVDSVFLVVDTVFTSAKNRALRHAERAERGPVLSVKDKAHAVADHYANEGKHRMATLMRKQIHAGLYDVNRVDELYNEHVKGR